MASGSNTTRKLRFPSPSLSLNNSPNLNKVNKYATVPNGFHVIRSQLSMDMDKRRRWYNAIQTKNISKLEDMISQDEWLLATHFDFDNALDLAIEYGYPELILYFFKKGLTPSMKSYRHLRELRMSYPELDRYLRQQKNLKGLSYIKRSTQSLPFNVRNTGVYNTTPLQQKWTEYGPVMNTVQHFLSAAPPHPKLMKRKTRKSRKTRRNRKN